MKKDSYWNVDEARLVHSKEGSSLRVSERPLWALFLERLGDEAAGSWTGHLLCCKTPEWLSRVRWGKLDEDGWTDRNLGYQLCRLGQWLNSGFGSWHQESLVVQIPVTEEWVQEHYPDAGWPFTEDDEEMHSTPDDAGEIRL